MGWGPGDQASGVPGFLRDGGAATRRILAIDWHAQPLGPPERWPDRLAIAVMMMLQLGDPGWLVWGDSAVLIANDAALALKPDGSANGPDERRAAWPPAIDACVGEVRRDRTTRMIGRVELAGRRFEGRVFAVDGEGVAVLLREVSRATLDAERQTALATLGEALRACSTVEDVAFAAARIAGETLHLCRAAYGSLDPPRERIAIEAEWIAPDAERAGGREVWAGYGVMREELRRGDTLILNEGQDGGGVGALVNVPVCDRGKTVAVFIAQDAIARRWTPEELAFLRTVADRVETAVARVHAEQQQRLLAEELAHRLKNTLATVQAIASQTLRGVDRAPLEAFEARLQALGTAHAALLSDRFMRVELATLLEQVLTPFSQSDRITMTGPTIELGPRAAQSTSLMMHELATNAVKYGALSVPAGTVTVRWRVDGDDGFALEWHEMGGPPVAAPKRRGFGSKLLRLGLMGTGQTSIRYEPTGLAATVCASLAALREG